MKVVLLKDVEKLGVIGDEKEVQNGFGRNWLIPKKLAVSVTDPKAKSIIEKAKKEKEKVAVKIKELKDSAEKLAGKIVEIKAKAGESGKLFGSVNSDDVAKALNLDKKTIEMQPIKEAGEHEIIINFEHGIKTKVKINITPVAAKKSASALPAKRGGQAKTKK